MNHLLSLLVTTGLLATPAMAAMGDFAQGVGTPSKGLAGAGAALALGSLAAAGNPAAAAFLGDELELDLACYNADRGYAVSGQPSGAAGTLGLAPGQVHSRSRAFLEPALGANWRLTPRMACNLALYGSGGGNTNYHSATFGASPTGIHLVQVCLAPAWAFRVTPGQAIGVAPLLAYQRFKASGLAAFAGYSADPADLSDRGPDTATGLGLRLGYQGHLGARLRLGASYQTRTRFSAFRNYRGLLPDQGRFDIPSTWTLGAAVQAGAGLTFVLDVQRINFSEVAGLGNPLLPNLRTVPLGANGGAGFGWRNVTICKLGTQWQATPRWILRAGYSRGRQPIPASQVLFNLLAPAVVEQRFAMGATRHLGAAWDSSLAVTRALGHSVTGPNPLEAPGQQTLTLRMDAWDVEAGLVARF